MEQPPAGRSSSQVTVECFDPFDLFEGVQPLLSRRLPLRNLHWKSPSRPLRSINTLQVNLKRAKDQKPSTALDGSNQRRHQIPGLRETPYLKALLFRCDDNETYKLSAKKLAREWVKANSTISQSTSSLNTQENHDAAEWLIIHVVLPDTPAASQARTSKHSSGGPADSTENVSGKSKWPGRGSSTILDKLRIDFKGSSKAVVDHVAQVRLPKSGASQSAAAVLSPQEIDALWEDLIEKLKSLILTSFDLRVQQYEEDIRERDSQRNLPGWNFCTFFVLKEGLARGFENVGLFDDALAGYDELSLGLDLIVREQALSGGDEHGGSFLSFTQELKDTAQQYLKEAGDVAKAEINGFQSNLPSLQLDTKEFPISANNKPYRELILANNVSVFQFRCYIFSRQLILLLQAANAQYLLLQSTEADLPGEKTSHEDENLSLLADACHRAADFISISSRTLRQDLEHGWNTESSHTSEESLREAIIRNIVLSWTYGVALQILTQTSTSNLSIPESTKDVEIIQADGSSEPTRDASPTLDQNANFKDASSAYAFNNNLSPRSTSLDLRSSVRPRNSRLGHDRLASCRAELILLARSVLQEVGAVHGWSCGWEGIGHSDHYTLLDPKALEEVQSDQTQDEIAIPSQIPLAAGISQNHLAYSMTKRNAFEELFEWLTDQALRHYIASKKVKSVESLTADIALLRYRRKDFRAASSYFSRLASFYENSSWDSIGIAMLELQANCLKNLGQYKEHQDAVLKLLACLTGPGSSSHHFNQSPGFLDPFITDLLASKVDSVPITAQLEQFYKIVKQPNIISHDHGQDGFRISVVLKSRLGQALYKEGALRITLTATEPSALEEIKLAAPGPISMSEDGMQYDVISKITTWAEYIITQVTLEIGNVTFSQESDFSPEQSLNFQDLSSGQQKRNGILVYPASGSLEARLVPCSLINLSQSRTIDVELRSGWNNIEYCTLRIKPATAGLRIRANQGQISRTSDADNIRLNYSDKDQNIILSHFQEGGTARLTLPYTLENPDITSISVRVEVTYETSKGCFEYAMNCSTNIGLALSVNVQDVFQKQCLFSRFTIGSAGPIPVNLRDCAIEDSEHYRVALPRPRFLASDVFRKEPMNLLYHVSPKRPLGRHIKPTPLELAIDYVPFDEWSLAVLEEKFSSDLMAYKDSRLQTLKHPLLQHFLGPFRSNWASKDLELVCMLREVEVPSYHTYEWPTALRKYSKTIGGIAEDWLQQWHQACDLSLNFELMLINLQENSTIRLTNEPPYARRVVVPVEILRPQFVVTASLELSSIARMPLAVGQSVAAKLRISHRSNWTVPSNEAAVEFSYEVFAPPELWLIAGRRKGIFTAHDSEEQTFPITILPQRPGHLLLPGLDIKASILERVESDVFPFKKTDLGCEVDYQSHAHSVLVVPNLRETTVALDGEDSSRRSWLVSSRTRNDDG